MTKYIIRASCEYSLEVEAESADLAMAEALKIGMADWDQAWSDVEVELIRQGRGGTRGIRPTMPQ